MKRKVVFSVIIALVLIVSGVTAVSAYESHLVNVQAHVENALWVNGETFNSAYGAYAANLNMGTVFPELQKELDVEFGLSNSFVAQYSTGWSTVYYNLYWEPKPVASGGVVADPWVITGNNYYQPIWPYMTVQIGASTVQPPVPSASKYATGPIPIVTSQSLYAPGNTQQDLHFIFNAPVFDYWYNSTTDPLNPPPGGILSYNNGSGYTIASETVTCSGTLFTVPVPNVDLGNNLKIQVIGFISH